MTYLLLAIFEILLPMKLNTKNQKSLSWLYGMKKSAVSKNLQNQNRQKEDITFQ